ncbi:MAG: DUF6438 domain-containing protein [Bacteroidota bacterium]
MRHLAQIFLLLSLAACSPKTQEQLVESPANTASAPSTAPSNTELLPIQAPSDPPPDEDLPPYLVAVLQKTDCHGNCPAYEARLFSDGHLIYRGRTGVERLGAYEAWAQTDLLTRIKTAAYRHQFFDLADAYPTQARPIEELPLTIIYLNLDDREKTVISNYNSPSRFRDLEQFLEDLFFAIDWREMPGGP